jgi:hypothetical protein
MLGYTPTSFPVLATDGGSLMLLQSFWLHVTRIAFWAKVFAQTVRQVSPPVSLGVGGLW